MVTDSRDVLATSEARAALTKITAAFRDEGTSAGVVVFGSHRKPEAAVIPYELLELLDPVVEDLVIAAQVRQRLAEDDGARYSLEELATSVGVDLAAIEAEHRDPAAASDST